MLRGNQSISYYSTANVTVWMLLALQAGMINTGGLLACHRFVSHVTGFATLFGVHAQHAESLEALAMLVVPAFFLTGAMLSGLFVDIRLLRQQKPWYFVPFGIIFVILLLVALAGIGGWLGSFGEPTVHARGYLLMILLCLACGLQNGTITTVSRSVVRTTHLTGITTDLGLGVVRYLLTGKERDEGRANLMRTGLILYFMIGSLAGAWLFPRFGFGGFLAPATAAGGLFAVTFYNQVIRKS